MRMMYILPHIYMVYTLFVDIMCVCVLCSIFFVWFVNHICIVGIKTYPTTRD